MVEVRHHVSKLRQNLGEMAIPLEFDPGADAQSDWGEAQVHMSDELVEELNELLLERLSADDKRRVPGGEMTIGEAREKERGHLLSLPKYPYRCCISRPVRPNRLSLVCFNGNSAVHTGKQNPEWAGHIAQKNYVAMGNYLVNEGVVKVIAEAFEASAGQDLEERLMRAIEAGRDAGGQHGGQHYAAALLVCDWEVFPRVDLRVDYHDEAIGELRCLLEIYKPLIPYYAQRPSDPTIGSAREWLLKQGTKQGQ